jgi:tetratricopeptide (TPR) repeat protein
MVESIFGILHDKSYDFPKKSIPNSLARVMEKEGINKALAYYKSIKDSSTYYNDENELIWAGYYFLQSDRAKEAAAIFKISTEAFPEAFNTYDSYGEALLALGNKAEGIENYKKSLKLNPNNNGAMEVLKENGVNTDELITKVPIEKLKQLEGTYVIANPTSDREKMWKIEFKEVQGVLVGNDNGYRYKLTPMGDNQFINPDDGASIVFDSKDGKAITMTLFKKFKFKKV